MKDRTVFAGEKVLWITLALITVLFCSQLSGYAADKKIILKKYPNIKIGFTTNNFSKVLPVSEPNVKKLIDFAREQGFAFIELRDSAAKLTLPECKAIAAYAKQQQVEVVYAVNATLLEANFEDTLARAIANANVFDGPRLLRMGAGGKELVADEKLGWTAEEFKKLVENGNRAANLTKMFGLTLAVENTREALIGDGASLFGTAELFGNKGVNSNMAWQMDTGTFFCVSHQPATPEEVKSFVEKNVTRIGYVHLRTSKGGKAQQVLCGNDLPFDTFFSICASNGKVYMALDLDTASTLEQEYANHLQSIEYLMKNY